MPKPGAHASAPLVRAQSSLADGSVDAPLTPIPFSGIYEALYRGNWRPKRAWIEVDMLGWRKLDLIKMPRQETNAINPRPHSTAFAFILCFCHPGTTNLKCH